MIFRLLKWFWFFVVNNKLISEVYIKSMLNSVELTVKLLDASRSLWRPISTIILKSHYIQILFYTSGFFIHFAHSNPLNRFHIWYLFQLNQIVIFQYILCKKWYNERYYTLQANLMDTVWFFRKKSTFLT